jgi:biopolymer transport protein ExbB
MVLLETFWATWDYLVQGGWVMVPMVAASIAMWALIIERLRTFHRLSRRDLASAAVLRAIDHVELPGAAQGLRATVMRRFLAVRSGRPRIDSLLLEEIAEKSRRSLRRGLAVIAVLAAIAPLLGLLGTVLGMIQTFEVIAVFGTSNARAMAGGISVALITTQTGLLVAIPGLFISGSLSRRATRLEGTLDEFTMSLRRIVLAKGNGSGGGGPQGPPLAAMEASAS